MTDSQGVQIRQTPKQLVHVELWAEGLVILVGRERERGKEGEGELRVCSD